MDPDATFDLIVAALADGDTAAADAACADLRRWLDGGGFPPDGLGAGCAAASYYDHFHRHAALMFDRAPAQGAPRHGKRRGSRRARG